MYMQCHGCRVHIYCAEKIPRDRETVVYVCVYMRLSYFEVLIHIRCIHTHTQKHPAGCGIARVGASTC